MELNLESLSILRAVKSGAGATSAALVRQNRVRVFLPVLQDLATGGFKQKSTMALIANY